MTKEQQKYSDSEPIKLGGGPHGLGDPDDKRLRKVEKDVILPKRLKEGAIMKCGRKVNDFLNCAKEAGLLMSFKCKEPHLLQELCIAKWMKYEPYIKEVTDKYLEERTYYRKTGQPLHPPPIEKKKKELPPNFDEEFPG